MNDSTPWKGKNFEKTLPSYGTDAVTYDKALAYCTQHNLTLAEFSRKAVGFFLSSESLKGNFQYPTKIPHKRKYGSGVSQKSKKGSSK